MKILSLKSIIIAASILPSLFINAQYKIGDIYDKDGLKGMVVSVDDSGEHGLLISIEKTDDKWLKDKARAFETSCFHEDDGQKNMDAITRYIAENNLTWDIFPAWKWARSLGEGWYIPAKDELKTIFNNLNGGNLDLNKQAKKVWKKNEKAIKSAKGDSFLCASYDTMGFKMLAGLYSSTELEGGKVWTMGPENSGKNLMNHPLGGPNVKIIPYELEKNSHGLKGNTFSKRKVPFHTRAVHKF